MKSSDPHVRFKIGLARAATKLASRDLQTFPVFSQHPCDLLRVSTDNKMWFIAYIVLVYESLCGDTVISVRKPLRV